MSASDQDAIMSFGKPSSSNRSANGNANGHNNQATSRQAVNGSSTLSPEVQRLTKNCSAEARAQLERLVAEAKRKNEAEERARQDRANQERQAQIEAQNAKLQRFYERFQDEHGFAFVVEPTPQPRNHSTEFLTAWTMKRPIVHAKLSELADYEFNKTQTPEYKQKAEEELKKLQERDWNMQAQARFEQQQRALQREEEEEQVRQAAAVLARQALVRQEALARLEALTRQETETAQALADLRSQNSQTRSSPSQNSFETSDEVMVTRTNFSSSNMNGMQNHGQRQSQRLGASVFQIG